MRGTLSYTLKQTFRDRWIWTLLLLIIIGTATSSFEILLSLTDSLTRQQQSYTKYNIGFIIMYGGKPAIIDDTDPFKKSTNAVVQNYPFNNTIASKISNKDGIEAVYRVTVVKVPHQLSEEKVYLGLVGVETEAAGAAVLPYANMWKGRFLSPNNDDCAVISNKLEEESGFTLNDHISLKIHNETETFSIIGVFGGLLPEELDPGKTIVIDLDRFWEIMNASSREHRYSALLVKVADPELGQNVTRQLREEYGRKEIYVVYQYTLARYTLELMSTTVSLYRITNILMLVASSAIIMLIRLVDLMKRKNELGLLTAIGWRERDVTMYLLLQSLLLGLIGSALGLMMAVGIGPLISKSLIPTELAFRAEIKLEVPSPAYLPYGVLVAITLSALAFTWGYLYYRRLTPLKMLEET